MNKLDDLKSIVDDEEVLQEMELKSTATEEEILVVKNTEEDKATEEDKPEETPVSPVEVQLSTAVVEKTPLRTSMDAFLSRVEVIKSQGKMGEDALRELQSSFDELGEVVRSEFTPKPSAEEAAQKNLESTLRSMFEAFEQKMMQTLSQTVAPIQSEVTELRALSLAGKPPAKKQEETPQPRSLNLNLVQKSAVDKLTQPAKSQFASLANTSVGLPENYVR